MSEYNRHSKLLESNEFKDLDETLVQEYLNISIQIDKVISEISQTVKNTASIPPSDPIFIKTTSDYVDVLKSLNDLNAKRTSLLNKITFKNTKILYKICIEALE